MKNSITLKQVFHVKPDVLYRAWLDSETHTAMTGGEANCTGIENEVFTTWDGYISGKNVQLEQNKKIVQAWRTDEFNADDEDSLLTITFTETPEGTELHLSHENIPEGQSQYEQGWIDHYFNPMKSYFEQS